MPKIRRLADDYPTTRAADYFFRFQLSKQATEVCWREGEQLGGLPPLDR